MSSVSSTANGGSPDDGRCSTGRSPTGGQCSTNPRSSRPATVSTGQYEAGQEAQAMSEFSRSEVEDAFAHFYNLGCVVEDWSGWAALFTDDARYVEHFWGEMHGPAEILAWINPVMAGVPEIYTVLDWYTIDGNTVVWSLQNRRDNPDPEAEPQYFDFPGLSVARYAGDGRWSYEEDYWDVRGPRATAVAYAEACARVNPDLET